MKVRIVVFALIGVLLLGGCGNSFYDEPENMYMMEIGESKQTKFKHIKRVPEGWIVRKRPWAWGQFNIGEFILFPPDNIKEEYFNIDTPTKE